MPTPLSGTNSPDKSLRDHVYGVYDAMRTKYAPLGLALQGVANLYLPLYCDLPEMAAGHAAEAAAHPGVVLGAYCGDVSHAPEGQTDNALVGLHSLPGVRLIGYMDRTGCHQLNRVLTHNNNLVKSGASRTGGSGRAGWTAR